MMLRSFAHSGLLGTGLSCTSSCSRPQRSTALPVLCKNKNRHNKSRGKQQQSPRQRKPKHQSSAWAFPPEPQLTPAEERALGLEFAASSLRRVGNLKGTIEQDSPKGLSNPIMAALFAKAESVTATFQAALDADPDSLTYKEISAVPWFEVSLSLAAGLADVMTHDVALPRIFAARHVFEELALHGSNPTGARDMFLHAPLVARLLSSAVPGFKAFLWLPAGPRYAAAAMQVEAMLLNEPQLLARALENPITAASDWENFLPPVENDVCVRGFASGTAHSTSVARQLSMQNGSSLFLITADEAAPSIHREVSGSSEPGL